MYINLLRDQHIIALHFNTKLKFFKCRFEDTDTINISRIRGLRNSTLWKLQAVGERKTKNNLAGAAMHYVCKPILFAEARRR